jgi:signal transduction histidine kinase
MADEPPSTPPPPPPPPGFHPPAVEDNRLFAGLAAADIQRILPLFEVRERGPGDIIFAEGDPGDGLYLVIEGCVRISKTGRGQQQETLGYIRPGDFFGEMAVIDGEPRSAQASAVEPCKLGWISTSTFCSLPATSPGDLRMNVLRSVVERLRGINSHFITELMRTERLSLLGSVANTIIHDLNNPLQVLETCTSLLHAKASDENSQQLLSIMRRATGRMKSLVEEILDFARGRSTLECARMPAIRVIEDIAPDLERLVPSQLQIEREIYETGEVNVDLGRFARVLMNLVKNSIDAMRKGGTITLGLRQSGSKVVFSVRDNGCGISPDLLPRIFEPFVTFGKSKGTGLGLAIARSVVEGHGGQIRVSSEVGVGTKVEVVLPAAG